MGEKVKSLSETQKKALMDHLNRLESDTDYANEFEMERRQNFLLCDTNLNGYLELSEWEEFCTN